MQRDRRDRSQKITDAPTIPWGGNGPQARSRRRGGLHQLRLTDPTLVQTLTKPSSPCNESSGRRTPPGRTQVRVCQQVKAYPRGENHDQAAAWDPKVKSGVPGGVWPGAWCSIARRAPQEKQTTRRHVVTFGHAYDSSESGNNGGRGGADAAAFPVATAGPPGPWRGASPARDSCRGRRRA